MSNVIEFEPRHPLPEASDRKSSNFVNQSRWSHPMDPQLKVYIQNQLAKEVRMLLLERVQMYLDVSGVTEDRRSWVIEENCAKVLRTCFDQIKNI